MITEAVNSKDIMNVHKSAVYQKRGYNTGRVHMCHVIMNNKTDKKILNLLFIKFLKDEAGNLLYFLQCQQSPQKHRKPAVCQPVAIVCLLLSTTSPFVLNM